MRSINISVSDDLHARLTLSAFDLASSVEQIATEILEAGCAPRKGDEAVYRRAVALAKAYVERLAARDGLTPNPEDLSGKARAVVDSGRYPQFIETARNEVEDERRRAAESLGL